MRKSKTAFVTLPVLVCLLAAGPSARSAETQPPPPGTASAALRADVQRQVDAFIAAILDDDQAAFSGLVTGEVLEHGAKRGIDLPRLLQKQRGALARTFRLTNGERPTFQVDDVLIQGDVLRVTLRYRGAELKKPFYFVRDGAGYKLSILPPGFSQAPPKEALFGSDNYTIENLNIYGNPAFTLRCYRGSGNPDGVITVPAASTRKISCRNACGWFSGSIFQDYYGNAPAQRCDWNWFGDDVIIDALYGGYAGWYCADHC
jgi:hypothetical protein